MVRSLFNPSLDNRSLQEIDCETLLDECLAHCEHSANELAYLNCLAPHIGFAESDAHAALHACRQALTVAHPYDIVRAAQACFNATFNIGMTLYRMSRHRAGKAHHFYDRY